MSSSVIVNRLLADRRTGAIADDYRAIKTPETSLIVAVGKITEMNA